MKQFTDLIKRCLLKVETDQFVLGQVRLTVYNRVYYKQQAYYLYYLTCYSCIYSLFVYLHLYPKQS